MTPPSIDAPSTGELWELLKTGRKFRALGKKESFALLRWGPMAVADLVAEWFETDLLQASVAARAIHGTAMGPWSAGTGAVLLLGAAIDPAPGGSSVTRWAGPARSRARWPRPRARRAPRSAPARTCADPREGRRRHRRRARGRHRDRRAPPSSPAPIRGGRSCGLIDPVELEPDFMTRIRNYRCPGTVAKLNFALARAAGVPRRDRRSRRGAARARPHRPGHRLSRARVRRVEVRRDVARRRISTSRSRPSTDPSMAPAGRHVMSVHMQYAPVQAARRTRGAARADALADLVLRTLEDLRARRDGARRARQVITPLDLEKVYGLTGGHIHHGELALDQLFARPMRRSGRDVPRRIRRRTSRRAILDGQKDARDVGALQPRRGRSRRIVERQSGRCEHRPAHARNYAPGVTGWSSIAR